MHYSTLLFGADETAGVGRWHLVTRVQLRINLCRAGYQRAHHSEPFDQDVPAITADLRRISDRFAKTGYLAVAPALYGRGPKSDAPSTPSEHISPAPAPTTLSLPHAIT